MALRLGILTTHPIQYQVPWFRALAAEPDIDLEVFFCMLPDEQTQGDGFGVDFKWDIPLLDGYRYRVLENRAAEPSVTRFGGCDTPEIYRVVREEPRDAYIVNGWVAKSCLQLLAACRRYRIPCIVRGESNVLRPRAAWKRAIHRLLLAQYRAFLAIGSQNRAFYTRNGVPEARIFDAPYCVENERFAPPADIERNARPFTFLFSGKLIPKKRPLDLLQGFAELRQRQSSMAVELVIVGDGELRAVCEAFVREQGLPVRFTGFLNQSRIIEAYWAADCLVLPSDHGETWGLVVNEAMAAGLPAIVSDQAGCHPDLVIQGETGYTFPMGDTTVLAEQMQRMAADPHRAQSMGQAAFRHVRTGYNYQRVVAGTLAALNALNIGR